MAREDRYTPAKPKGRVAKGGGLLGGIPGFGGGSPLRQFGQLLPGPAGGLLFGDGGDEIANQRQETIGKAVGLLGDAQGVQYGQRQANLRGLEQIFRPMNARLQHLYGSGAAVPMPQMGGPLDAMFSQPKPAPQGGSASKRVIGATQAIDRLFGGGKR